MNTILWSILESWENNFQKVKSAYMKKMNE